MRIARLSWLALSLGMIVSAANSVDWIGSLGGKVGTNPQGRTVSVNLRGTWVSDVELIDVARLPGLEWLDLSHTRITDEGMRNLKPASGIRELNLYYAEQITDQGMTAIKNWKMLRRLDLRGTRVSNGTLEILSHMPQLEALHISNTQVTENGMDFLIALTNLKELTLGRSSRAGEVDLSFLRMLPSLTVLDLSGARPSPPDTNAKERRVLPRPVMSQKTVASLAELRNLQVLKLGYSGISSEDLKDLGTLKNISKLGLEECSRIDDAAVPVLAHWRALKYVDLQATQVTPEAVSRLRKARPDMEVLYTPASSSLTASGK